MGCKEMVSDNESRPVSLPLRYDGPAGFLISPIYHHL